MEIGDVGAGLHVARRGVSGVRSTASYVWPKSDFDLSLALHFSEQTLLRVSVG